MGNRKHNSVSWKGNISHFDIISRGRSADQFYRFVFREFRLQCCVVYENLQLTFNRADTTGMFDMCILPAKSVIRWET